MKISENEWINTSFQLLVGVIAAIFIYFVVLTTVLSTATPVVAVFSNSMVPEFFQGDMIIVYGDKNVSAGDIIVFNAPGKNYPIIHRAYEVTDNGIRTKGDANSGPDPWTIQKSNIYGKSILKVPLLGWVKIIFTTITGLG